MLDRAVLLLFHYFPPSVSSLPHFLDLRSQVSLFQGVHDLVLLDPLLVLFSEDLLQFGVVSIDGQDLGLDVPDRHIGLLHIFGAGAPQQEASQYSKYSGEQDSDKNANELESSLFYWIWTESGGSPIPAPSKNGTEYAWQYGHEDLIQVVARIPQFWQEAVIHEAEEGTKHAQDKRSEGVDDDTSTGTY